jgi:spore coat polysaccharide biosynthesis protein SpsF (cytidylyltransferase family)
VRQVYARFQAPWDFGWREVLDLLDREPELLAINAHVRQKTFREAE